jgi:hypothetical protein
MGVVRQLECAGDGKFNSSTIIQHDPQLVGKGRPDVTPNSHSGSLKFKRRTSKKKQKDPEWEFGVT